MALHVSDFSKAAKDIVVDLINHDNVDANLTPELLDFGLPTLATGETPPANTDLEVTAAEGSGYVGSVVVQYNRLQLQDFVGARGIDGGLRLPVGDATRFAALIPEINVALGINLTEDDYVDGDIGEWEGVPNETKEINIVVNADSLVFLGSLTLTLTAEDIPLNSVITSVLLSGLNLPVAEPEQV